jgi:hypothetical protein
MKGRALAVVGSGPSGLVPAPSALFCSLLQEWRTGDRGHHGCDMANKHWLWGRVNSMYCSSWRPSHGGRAFVQLASVIEVTMTYIALEHLGHQVCKSRPSVPDAEHLQ